MWEVYQFGKRKERKLYAASVAISAAYRWAKSLPGWWVVRDACGRPVQFVRTKKARCPCCEGKVGGVNEWV